MRSTARAFAFALAVPLLMSVAAAEAPKFAKNATSFTLDNGLEVVVIPDHRAPIVTHMVWYKAGAADERPGESGIAHFLEHLMFKGTRNHPEGEFSKAVNSVGGNENAFTTDDVTVYHQTVAKQHLPLMMEFEADRMANLVLSDAAVKTERDVILEERRSRIDSDPRAQLGEAVRATLFQNSRYGVPTIGWAHEMAELDLADAVSWYDRYYTPNNAVVIVAGDVTEAEVRQLADATYGKVARRFDPPPRLRATEPEPRAARTVTLSDPQVTQSSMQRVYLAPSYVTGKPGEGEALDLLAEILGGGTTSRLYRDLVVGKAIAASAGAFYQSGTLGEAMFGFYGVPRGEATLAELETAFDAAIAELLDKGVTEAELAGAKRRLLAATVYAEDNAEALARSLGTALATGATLQEAQNWPAAIDAVTVDEVNAAARAYLDIRRSVTGYLVGEPSQSPS
ncbi:MAG TPA: pitrilysin family protein [Bauldia sp.]|nr:pitrilysin family protein [Bauldia sp.]